MTQARIVSARAVEPRPGPLVAILGAAMVLLGFFLPWLSFDGVVAGSAPNIAGHELPGFVRTTAFLGPLSESAVVDPAVTNFIMLVPVLALVALLAAALALKVRRARRGAAVFHLVVGLIALTVTAYLFWSFSKLAPAGMGAVLEFVGLGLWLTVGGMMFIVLGGVAGAAGR